MNNNTVPAVEKTIALLEFLAEIPKEKGITQNEIKKELDLSMSSAYRILQTLLEANWLKKREDGVYFPGNGLFTVLAKFRKHFPIREELQELLDEVAFSHHIACKISIREGAEQITILRSEPDGPVALTGKSFSRFPVIEGASGASLLVGSSLSELQSLAANCPWDIPEKREPERVLLSLAHFARNGYIRNISMRWHITSYSLPLYASANDPQPEGAHSFILPGAQELPEEEEKRLVELLKDTREKCENIIHTKGDLK